VQGAAGGRRRARRPKAATDHHRPIFSTLLEPCRFAVRLPLPWPLHYLITRMQTSRSDARLRWAPKRPACVRPERSMAVMRGSAVRTEAASNRGAPRPRTEPWIQKSSPRRYTCLETGRDPKRSIIGGVLPAGGGRSATTRTVAGSALTTTQARTPHFPCLKRASAEAASVRLLFVAVGAASRPSVSGADSPFRVAVTVAVNEQCSYRAPPHSVGWRAFERGARGARGARGIRTPNHHTRRHIRMRR
jgi:hypothetical protein